MKYQNERKTTDWQPDRREGRIGGCYGRQSRVQMFSVRNCVHGREGERPSSPIPLVDNRNLNPLSPELFTIEDFLDLSNRFFFLKSSSV